jgi:hypothetical protein
MSGPTYNQAAPPSMPSYGEGMADALQAQVELLTGKGDRFSEIAPDGLEGLLPLEKSLREKTAQVDTDVLRQTLLGGETQETTRGRYDDEGRFITGERPTFTETPGKPKISYTFTPDGTGAGGTIKNLRIIDPSTNKTISSFSSLQPADLGITGDVNSYNIFSKINKRFQDGMAGNYQNAYDNAKDQVQPTRVEGDPEPIYGRDAKGDIIIDKSKAGTEVDETVTVQNEGMIDVLGDKRLTADGREAGYDRDGNFLGLAALSEDIQQGNLSRQREADISDVEALDERYKAIMDEFAPATTSGVDDARKLLEQQRENLTGLREATQADIDEGNATKLGEMIQTGDGNPVGIPTADTYGGDVKGSTMTAAKVGATPTLDATTSFTAAQVANPLALKANTQFGGEAGLGQASGTDSLRSALLADAKGALSNELTDRERRRISEAFKGQSTMMGRTFDQSAGITEAEALTQEDRNRQMQNRAFAQSALGQESGLQQGDITRGMAQESEQARLNQAKALADAQMLQQQRAMGLEAGMLQDSQQAELDQGRILAQAELDQQAGAFDAQSSQQAKLANQAQSQQANQFGVGATMDAERLNEQLRQQGLANYIGAVGNLAQIEDQYTLDPFAAILGRGGGGSLQAGQSVFGQAGYGLQSGPQYLNPEAGLGYISQMAANDASMYAANQAAQGAKTSGLFQGLGSLGAGLLSYCWVAREVYGVENPAWLRFRMWMFSKSPDWFFKLYGEYGERFASWISDKPRIKALVRKWMDSKIRG